MLIAESWTHPLDTWQDGQTSEIEMMSPLYGLIAQGAEALRRGDLDGAKGFFIGLLEQSQEHADGATASALYNLGVNALQSDDDADAYGWFLAACAVSSIAGPDLVRSLAEQGLRSLES